MTMRIEHALFVIINCNMGLWYSNGLNHLWCCTPSCYTINNACTCRLCGERQPTKSNLLSCRTSTLAGEDNISCKFLRDAAEVISSPLTYIMNLSLKSATVPDDFKLARVLPIYKKETEILKETIDRCQSYRLHQKSLKKLYTDAQIFKTE